MNDIDFQLFETSAKENLNVEEMFRAVTKLVLRSKRDQESVEARSYLVFLLQLSLIFQNEISTRRQTIDHNDTPTDGPARGRGRRRPRRPRRPHTPQPHETPAEGEGEIELLQVNQSKR